MEQYATKEATIALLQQLGFTRVAEGELFFDSPKINGWGLPVIQLFAYQSSNGYWCVDVGSGYRAPVIWNGPKAEWDKTNMSDTFIAWLDKHCPGWH